MSLISVEAWQTAVCSVIPSCHRGSLQKLLQWSLFFLLFCFVLFFAFLGLQLQHTEVPRLGVQLELQLPAYATATAMRHPNRAFDLHHGSQQCQILNSLREARNRTRILVDPSKICSH